MAERSLFSVLKDVACTAQKEECWNRLRISEPCGHSTVKKEMWKTESLSGGHDLSKYRVGKIISLNTCGCLEL